MGGGGGGGQGFPPPSASPRHGGYGHQHWWAEVSHGCASRAGALPSRQRSRAPREAPSPAPGRSPSPPSPPSPPPLWGRSRKLWSQLFFCPAHLLLSHSLGGIRPVTPRAGVGLCCRSRGSRGRGVGSGLAGDVCHAVGSSRRPHSQLPNGTTRPWLPPPPSSLRPKCSDGTSRAGPRVPAAVGTPGLRVRVAV